MGTPRFTTGEATSALPGGEGEAVFALVVAFADGVGGKAPGGEGLFGAAMF